MMKGQTGPVEPLRIFPQEMENEFRRILQNHGFNEPDAERCAQIFVENSLAGVYTHGVNRFARFIKYIRNGHIDVSAKPVLKHRLGSIEQWDGRLGPGPLNALHCTGRAMEIAKESGIGCVAISNTNHWMRGGTYGWRAAKAGFVLIAWTNTTANMPAWGAVDPRLGNNPLVIAIPFGDEAIVLDMAMSQFSYGTIEAQGMEQKRLSFYGGYGRTGELTTEPGEILATGRLLPAGLWKGAGLALLLDVLAMVLSDGSSTCEISRRKAEYGVSQIFIALDSIRLPDPERTLQKMKESIEDYRNSVQADDTTEIVYPGERSLRIREENRLKGIPVHPDIWNEILELCSD